MSNDEQAENLFNQGMALVNKMACTSTNQTDCESALKNFKTALGLVEGNTQLCEKLNLIIGQLEIAIEAVKKRDSYREVGDQLASIKSRYSQ